MVASEQIPSAETRQAIVERAAASLCRVRHLLHESLVNVPTFYPSGAGATVSIAVNGLDLVVTDLGRAFHEASLIGAESLFPRRAKAIAEKYGLEIADRSFVARSSAAQLSAAISDVAIASTETAHYVMDRIRVRGETEIAYHLYQRLVTLFGAAKVDAATEIVGASSRKWDISAVVKSERQWTAFKVVGAKAGSVYYSSAAIHDIGLLPNPPKMVSVVEQIEAMGSLYNILAQAGDVLEESASNDALERIVAA